MKIVAVRVIAGLVLLSACGGSGEEVPSATTFVGEAATQTTTVESPTPGPESSDVPLVDCGPLITPRLV